MKYIDVDLLRKEIERLVKLNKECAKAGGDRVFLEGITAGYADILSFLDTLPEQPVEYPTSTEMIAEWENNELPMLREKDFRGDAERMAYNAFMDGFAKGLGYRK